MDFQLGDIVVLIVSISIQRGRILVPRRRYAEALLRFEVVFIHNNVVSTSSRFI